MLERIKKAITSARELEGKELFELMRGFVDDAESEFDKIIEGMDDEAMLNIRNNLGGYIGAVALLGAVVGEKAGCLNSAATDEMLDALPDVMSDLKLV